MSTQIVTPSQIRAARAFLDWSQDQLAKEAQVGVNSVRDVESQKRPADSGAVASIRQALENAGLVFLTANEEGGPGVRLATNRPTLLRRPTVAVKWEGVPFEVEWRGKAYTVFVHYDALEDLGRLTNPTNEQLLQCFNSHQARVLDVVAKVITNQVNFDERGFLHVRGKDFV